MTELSDRRARRKAWKQYRDVANRYLANVCEKYWDDLPLQEVACGLYYLEIELVDTPRRMDPGNGRVTLPLTFRATPVDNVLVFEWHRIDVTGRYEIVSYVS